MTRAEAEAKADTAIRVTWGQRVFAWLSWAISVVVIILALLLIISTITVQADPCASIQAMNGTESIKATYRSTKMAAIGTAHITITYIL
jgi:hypothetical protein